MVNKHMKICPLPVIIQKYNEVSHHTEQIRHQQKIYKWYMLEKVWRKGSHSTALVGM